MTNQHLPDGRRALMIDCEPGSCTHDRASMRAYLQQLRDEERARGTWLRVANEMLQERLDRYPELRRAPVQAPQRAKWTPPAIPEMVPAPAPTRVAPREYSGELD